MSKEKKTTVQSDYQTIHSAVYELSLEELVTLEIEVGLLIERKQTESWRVAYNQMQSLAQAAGFESIEAFTADQTGTRPIRNTRGKMPQKYRNPHNAQQTWSGQGRKPGWVLMHLGGGGQMEELKVG